MIVVSQIELNLQQPTIKTAVSISLSQSNNSCTHCGSLHESEHIVFYLLRTQRESEIIDSSFTCSCSKWPRTSKEDYFCNSSQLGAEENSSAGLRMFLRNAL
mmetsp:Transcript_5595/g.34715  ORF Transcript_5595/g.34715 Transcript_5595/m.34715 type:complete len:102 (-) Transcript_5595:760-1065(-)